MKKPLQTPFLLANGYVMYVDPIPRKIWHAYDG